MYANGYNITGQSLLYYQTADREVQRILLELLNQMDGFDQSVNVKVYIIYVRDKPEMFTCASACNIECTIFGK